MVAERRIEMLINNTITHHKISASQNEHKQEFWIEQTKEFQVILYHNHFDII